MRELVDLYKFENLSNQTVERIEFIIRLNIIHLSVKLVILNNFICCYGNLY